MFATTGCKKEGPVDGGGTDQPQMISALFASVDGNWTGIWVFDTDSLSIIDSFPTQYGAVPFSIEFSPDYSLWYTILQDNSNNHTIFSIDARTKNIFQQTLTQNPFLISADNGKYLIGYYIKVTEIFDRRTFILTRLDSLGWVDRAVACPKTSKIYLLSQSYNLSDPGPRVVVYDLQDFNIKRVIEFADSTSRKRMGSAAIAISPDGKYLFLTVFNWVGGGGYGSFHAIDLKTDQVVAEFLCGKFSQMGVSLDGRYVYITDPAGYLYEMNPTGHLLRYDVYARTMELFIDWVPYNITGGAHGSRLITDQIVILPDNRTMFLTTPNGQTIEGENIAIMKFDLDTKQVMCIYSIPPDYRGYITKHIRKLKLGKYVYKE